MERGFDSRHVHQFPPRNRRAASQKQPRGRLRKRAASADAQGDSLRGQQLSGLIRRLSVVWGESAASGAVRKARFEGAAPNSHELFMAAALALKWGR